MISFFSLSVFFFLFLPFPLAFGALLCAVVVLFQGVIAPSTYFRLLTNNTADTEIQAPETEEGEFPVIPYESQWATLNVDGWQRRNVKVFFGNMLKTLTEEQKRALYDEMIAGTKKYLGDYK